VDAGPPAVVPAEPEAAVGLPLLFRLVGDRGRRVQQASRGRYLAVVPRDWELEGSLPDPVEGGAAAYEIDVTEPPAFRVPGGGVERPWSPRLRVRVEGALIEERRDRMGPLFGTNAAPVLSAPAEDWNTVREVILLQEGPGWGRRRRRLEPGADSGELDIREALAEIGACWVCARFYGEDQHLVDSLDFRWMPGLEAVRAPAGSALPGATGHEPPVIEVEHRESLEVTPLTPDAVVAEERLPDGTGLRLRPEAIEGPVRLRLRDGPLECEVHVPVALLWWAVAPENRTPEEWEDEPIPVERSQFLPTANTAIWLRRTATCGLEALRIGPTWERARPVPRGSDGVAPFPLREFESLEEIRKGRRLQLCVWEGSTSITSTIREL